MSHPTSLRLSSNLDERLGRRAVAAGEARASLARRYIDEGLRMDEHPLIAFVTRGGGRRPMLAGTRLDVADVVETLRQSRNSVDETAAYLDLPRVKVQAAVRYYADFPDEVDEWLERRRALAEREEALWRKEQAALS